MGVTVTAKQPAYQMKQESLECINITITYKRKHDENGEYSGKTKPYKLYYI